MSFDRLTVIRSPCSWHLPGSGRSTQRRQKFTLCSQEVKLRRLQRKQFAITRLCGLGESSLRLLSSS